MTAHLPCRELARAKLNLSLRITGRRADGYHLIESCVVFAALADVLEVAPAETLSLTLTGAFAEEAGVGEGNLVLRAARLLQQTTGTTKGAALTLEKHIPVGAGLGGGSADAAAALRALNAFWELGLSLEQLLALAPQLGADVAMCLASEPALARGFGDELAPLPFTLPPLYALLAHPRIPLLTKDVYAALHARGFTPSPAISEMQFADYVAANGNDLEAPARQLAPTVDAMLRAMQGLMPQPLLVRMTGSGACCFALYTVEQDAEDAAEMLRSIEPGWWVVATRIGA